MAAGGDPLLTAGKKSHDPEIRDPPFSIVSISRAKPDSS
jgi:hypothetical protein